MKSTAALVLTGMAVLIASCSGPPATDTPTTETRAPRWHHRHPDNFVRDETDRTFRDIAALSGGKVNTFAHIRAPTPLDQQTVSGSGQKRVHAAAIG